MGYFIQTEFVQAAGPTRAPQPAKVSATPDVAASSSHSSSPSDSPAVDGACLCDTAAPAAERRAALGRLIATRAEKALTACLAADDNEAVQMAATGLWELWYGEAGPEARRSLELGIEAMNAGELDSAAAIFSRLAAKYPDWPEAENKLATVLYLQGKPRGSIALCQSVVAKKPDHFGAWNGLALCAIQVEDWPLALRAVRESLRLQPRAEMNLRLLKLVESRMPEA